MARLNFTVSSVAPVPADSKVAGSFSGAGGFHLECLNQPPFASPSPGELQFTRTGQSASDRGIRGWLQVLPNDQSVRTVAKWHIRRQAADTFYAMETGIAGSGVGFQYMGFVRVLAGVRTVLAFTNAAGLSFAAAPRNVQTMVKDVGPTVEFECDMDLGAGFVAVLAGADAAPGALAAAGLQGFGYNAANNTAGGATNVKFDDVVAFDVT